MTVVDPGDRRAGLQARVGRRAPGRAGRAAGRRRGRRPRGRRGRGTACSVLVTAGGTREPIDSRALRRQPLARAAWASRWPRRPPRCGAEVTVVAANVGLAAHPARALRRRRAPPPSCRPPARREFAARRRAAHGRRGRRLPARRRRPTTKLKKDGARRLVARARAHRRTSSPASPPSAAPGQTLVGFAAEHGDGARRLRARQARAQGPRRRSSSTTSRARTSASTASDNEVTIVTAAGERHVPRASKAEVARAILDGGRRPAQRRSRHDSVSMESIEEEPGPVGEAEIASAAASSRRQVALAITDAVEVRRELLGPGARRAWSPRATS